MTNTDPHCALPPDIRDLLERADAGEWWALARVYGNAGALIKKGLPIPEPLGAWMAARLGDLAANLNAKGKTAAASRKDQHAPILRALRIVRTGSKGRPRSRRAELWSQALVGDVKEFIGRGLSPYEACKAVVKFHAEKKTGIAVDLKTVESAWNARPDK